MPNSAGNEGREYRSDDVDIKIAADVERILWAILPAVPGKRNCIAAAMDWERVMLGSGSGIMVAPCVVFCVL